MNLFLRNTAANNEDASTFLVVGLGNPGREYRETRHNIGFMVIDRLGETLNGKLMKVQSKAIIGITKLEGNKIILAKPQTYMNLSGQAVSALAHFYKIGLDHIIVAHDDVDLQIGRASCRERV